MSAFFRLSCLLALIATTMLAGSHADEPHAQVLEERLLSTCDALLAREPNARLLAFWDFDGTLLRGDCSEGLEENGRVIYKGLAQRAIEAGLSKQYPTSGDFARFWQDYRYLDERVGHWLAYPFLPQILAGANERDVVVLARQAFDDTYHRHLFRTSLRLFQSLKRHGVENHVISASAELFVRGSVKWLGIPEEHVHGIRLVSREGKLTHELLYPVTYAEGKRTLLRKIAGEDASRPVYVIAAFGNSYGTDSAFLDEVAETALPAGQTTAVMFNGGTPPNGSHHRFLCFDQNAVVGDDTTP